MTATPTKYPTEPLADSQLTFYHSRALARLARPVLDRIDSGESVIDLPEAPIIRGSACR